MRPIIKWVDEVGSDAFGRILPSHTFALVKAVREEALDEVELTVRREKLGLERLISTRSNLSTTGAVLETILNRIRELRKL